MQRGDFDIKSFNDDISMSESDVISYRIGDDPIPLLYQAGYLTIKSYNEENDEYKLQFPNEEVKRGFFENLYSDYLNMPSYHGVAIRDFIKDLRSGDVESLMTRFKAFFASIPYGLRKHYNAEEHFQTAFYIFFTLLGMQVESEIHLATGRTDAVVKTADYIYVMEFKMSDAKDGTADAALSQIDSKGYLIPYTVDGRTLIKLGVVCDADPQVKNIGEWKQG
jgi:hypothetical protein